MTQLRTFGRHRAAPSTCLNACLLTLVAMAGGAQAQGVPCPDATNIWQSGDFAYCGPITYLTLPTLEIVGADTKTFSRFAVPPGFTDNVGDFTGPVNWRGGRIEMSNLGFGAPILLQRGEWLAHGDDTLALFGGEFRNSAGFRKLDGTGETTVQLGGGIFRNTTNLGAGTGLPTTGVIEARSGSIAFRGSNAGQILLEDGSQVTGAGRVVAALASNVVAGRLFSDNLELASGTHVGQGVVLAGGVAGPGVLRISGGNLGGQWRVAAGTELHAIGAGGQGVNLIGGAGEVELVNQGTLRWQRADFAGLGGPGVLRNEGSFVFETTGGGAAWNGFQTAPLFDNAGTLRAATGVSAHMLANGFRLDNTGTLQADAGATLRLSGSNNAGGPYSVRLLDGTRIVGAGQVQLAGAVDIIGRAESENAVLVSGQFRGGGDQPGAGASLAGTWQWAGGLVTGTVEIAPDGVLRVDTPQPQGRPMLAMQFTNRGLIDWTSADSLGLGGGGVLRNEGVMDFGSDAGVLWNGFQGQASFVNAGLIVKTAGDGTTALNSPVYAFSNPGTIQVQSGAIALPANFVNTGTLMGNGRFIAPGLINQGVIAPGNSPGLLTLDGSLTLGATGALAIELENLQSFDQLLATGPVALGGTLALSCFGTCSFAVGDSFTFIDSATSVSGDFASLTLSGFATGAFDVVYDMPSASVRLVVTQAVSAVPEPATVALWLAGLAGMAHRLRRRRPA